MTTTKGTKNTEQLPSPIVHTAIDQVTRVPSMSIKNFDKLVVVSKNIAKQAEKLAHTHAVGKKPLRQRRIKINKLSRTINDLRKHYGLGYKHLTKQSNILRKILGQGTKALNVPLKQYQQQKKDELKHRLEKVMHEYCQNAGIPDQPVPDDALKISMSKLKRAKLLNLAVKQGEQQVKQYLYWKRLHVAKIENHKAIDPTTHNVLGVAEQHYIIGQPKAVKQVKQLAEKLHVYIQ